MSLLNVPLSNERICNALGVPENDIILYKKLHQYDNIDDLFKEDNFKIILIESKKNNGHWVSLAKDGDSYVFFDSYGLSPDAELAFIPKLQRMLLGEDHRELSRLLRGKKLIYNRIVFQGKTSSTCGRWVIAFIEMRKMGYSLPQFQQFVKRHKTTSYDNLVCQLVPI